MGGGVLREVAHHMRREQVHPGIVGRAHDLRGGAEGALQLRLQTTHMGVPALPWGILRRSPWFLLPPNLLLDRPDGQTLLRRATRHLGHAARIIHSKEGAGVSHGQLSLAHHRLDRGGQLQQPQKVGYRRPILADAVRDLPLRVAELVHEPPVGFCLLERRQISPLNVLDDGKNQEGPIVDLSDDYRNLGPSESTHRAPAPLPRDQLPFRTARGAFRCGADHQRLQETILADRTLQLPKLFGSELPARLQRIGRDARNGHHPVASIARIHLLRQILAEKCAQPLPKARLTAGVSARLRLPGRPRAHDSPPAEASVMPASAGRADVRSITSCARAR